MTQQIHGYRGWKGTKASGAAVIAIAATVLLWFGKIDADAWTTALFIAAGLLGAGDVLARIAARPKSNINNL